jgi:Ca-activated chloride channel family protein
METMTAANSAKRTAQSSKLGMFCALSFALCALSFPLEASTYQLKEGNRQFKNGNYDKASELYQDALIDTPYSSILQFNLGDALAMNKDLPKSEVAFMEAAKSANPLLKGASHYNRGNVLFAQGKWSDAIEAYKDALRANPRDEDAKYNLGIALRAKNNPPPPKQGQGKQDQKQGKSGDKDQNKPQDGNNQQKSGQMSKEDAERLLAAAGAGEKKKEQQKMPKGDVPHPDEDW